jgi:hypothetical protein
MLSGGARFVFAIPLRPRSTARNWNRVCQLLDHTLKSVLQQEDEEFSVLLACHEAPDIPAIADPRITILTTKHRVPTTFAEQMADKGKKKRVCTAAFKMLGGGYLMFLDADDMVSRKLVRSVRSHPTDDGYIITQGYHYDSKTQHYHRIPAFDKRCGSCAVFRFSVDDLPDHPDDPRIAFCDRYGNHTEWREMARRLGRTLEPIGFPAAVHVVETNENASAIQPRPGTDGLLRLRRRLIEQLRMHLSRRPVDDFFRSEFGLPWTHAG